MAMLLGLRFWMRRQEHMNLKFGDSAASASFIESKIASVHRAWYLAS